MITFIIIAALIALTSVVLYFYNRTIALYALIIISCSLLGRAIGQVAFYIAETKGWL